MTKVKVCGMTRTQDIDLALQAGATHLGLILTPESPRCISQEQARELRTYIGERATVVGVFRKQQIENVIALADSANLDWIQLHGGFSTEDISMAQQAGYPVMWAVPVSPDGHWEPVGAQPDMFLMDTKRATSFGGTGTTFQWSKAQRPNIPFFLAGGIGNHNAIQAFNTLRPDGLDLNSALEDNPGQKSAAALKQLKTTIHELQSLPDTNTRIQMTDSTPKDGRWGRYGGAYMPETLFAPLERVLHAWEDLEEDDSFWNEFHELMTNYVGRPSPITRAPRLEKAWDTSGPVFFKREDLNHTGAHKINNSIGQILLARRMGKTRIVAETGAGQHGVATATACAKLGLDCVVYMGEIDMKRQALNVFRMRLLGAEVRGVDSGSKTLKDAINEAMRDWVSDPENTFYCLGSALGPHPYPVMVRAFQAQIGTEARRQYLDATGELPSAIVACVGGGSNSIGIFSGFLDDEDVALFGGEAGGHGVETGEHASRFAGGQPGVLHGTRTYLLQNEAGQVRETHSISAGLDYPAIGPEHAYLHDTGRAEYLPVNDDVAIEAFHECSQLEGIFPALESAHAVALAKHLICERKINHERGVLINMSGRGDKDVYTVAELEGVDLP